MKGNAQAYYNSAVRYGLPVKEWPIIAGFKIDLGKETTISEIRCWSFNQGGNRGTQKFTIFGIKYSTLSAAAKTVRKRVPLAMVNTAAIKPQKYVATKLITSDGTPIGTFRWIELVLQPISGANENTAFQEVQIIGEQK